MRIIFCAALTIIFALPMCARAEQDKSLVLHYTFDQDNGNTVKDQSTYGNDGKLVNQFEFHKELDGRSGVVRFASDSSYIDCGGADSLRVSGDITLEMWMRQHSPVKSAAAYIFGDHPSSTFFFGESYWSSLHVWYGADHESTVVPVRRDIINDKWSHIAVVIAYPRIRFYQNGQLVRDAYMPLSGIAKSGPVAKFIGSDQGNSFPMDLDEIRLYQRALSPSEIAAHAEGKEIPPKPHEELAVDTNWYEKTVTARVSCQGADYTNREVELKLQRVDSRTRVASQKVKLAESFPGSGRFVATATFPLAGLENQTVDAVASFIGAGANQKKIPPQSVAFKKPEWVDSKDGVTDEVLAPWTPVQSDQKGDDSIELRVWGRRLSIGSTPFAQQIETAGAEMLASPITLKAVAGGKTLEWQHKQTKLTDGSKTAASFVQDFQNDSATLHIEGKIEFDGYTIYDCRLQAKRDLSLQSLVFEIPLHTEFATLGYGDKVFEPDAKVPINQWFSGAIKKDLGFRFSPDVWLGDEERGLLWQTESDEYWHVADEKKAIEILPRDKVTTFRANFVNVETKLAAGDSLRYKFALQATPSKPLLRDAWDLRIARNEPYGGDLDMPDRTLLGKPAIDYVADAGVKRLFTICTDVWGDPLPHSDLFKKGLHRFIDATHQRSLQSYTYMMYTVAFPIIAPEFETYGFDMCARPMKPFIESISPPGEVRPGPVSVKYGADREGVMLTCPNSKAMQDAYSHRLAMRYERYGDDGFYLDGGGELTPCSNLEHGCGYRAKDGTIHPTFPAFAMREFRKRIYTVLKQRKPDGVVDYHCSFAPNQAAFAYSDVIWTGEHWWHLRSTGTKHILGELTLDKFRTEFTGRQFGVAAETLAYRLGSPMRVSAISLLHDIPVRPSTPIEVSENPKVRETDHFEVMSKLWHIRDQFGAKDAEKLFYYNNQDYVSISGKECFTTLLKHPTNGVLAFVSNLSTEDQKPIVELKLDKLGLGNVHLEALNPLTDQPIEVTADGKFSLPLGSEQWAYVWVRPAKAGK